VFSSHCLTHAWGKLGHELVAELGSELAQETAFFRSNSFAMRVQTNTPDNVWKVGASRNLESTTHWFEPDSYSQDPNDFILFPRQYTQALSQFGEARLNKNGTAPWRILQTYDEAVTALQSQNWVKALQMAGVMSHYIGDLSQPLHVTVNFDGQLTNQKGIHSFFESTNLGRFDRTELKNQIKSYAQTLLASPRFLQHFEGKVVDVAFNSVLRSYQDKNEVLSIDQRLGRNTEGSRAQISIAVRRMADAAATLALILDRMWISSGLRNSPAKTIEVPVPAFLNPVYYDEGTLRRRALNHFMKTTSFGNAGDVEIPDCQTP
jgi:hypothetical protein